MPSLRCSGWVRREGNQVIFHLARILRSPNTWQGRHWRVKDRETKAWQAAFESVVPVGGACRPVSPVGRMRVTVTRLCPSRRHFIRDADNLRFCVKPLNDALTRLGYLHDDSEVWLEQPDPDQQMSADGQHWTLVRIAPCPA